MNVDDIKDCTLDFFNNKFLDFLNNELYLNKTGVLIVHNSWKTKLVEWKEHFSKTNIDFLNIKFLDYFLSLKQKT